MKLHPIYSIFVLFLFFYSCQGGGDKPAPKEVVILPVQNKVEQTVIVPPNQARAEKAVVDWIMANSYDPANYQAVGFGELDSIIEYREEIQKIHTLIFDASATEAMDDQPSKINIDSLKQLVESAEKEFFGYGIIHSASGKNQFGVLEVTTYVFYLDTAFKVIEHTIKQDPSYGGESEDASGEVGH